MTDLATTPVEDPGGQSREPWVLTATGLIDDRWTDLVRAAAAKVEPSRATIIDLSDAILVSRRPLVAALHAVTQAGQRAASIAVVCPRLSAQMLLRRWGIAKQIAVFPTREDAEAAVDRGNESS